MIHVKSIKEPGVTGQEFLIAEFPQQARRMTREQRRSAMFDAFRAANKAAVAAGVNVINLSHGYRVEIPMKVEVWR